MQLSALSPFGPIFGKELRVTARRKRGYFLRVAYLAGLMLFLLLAYTSTSRMGSGGSAVMRAQAQQELGPIFFAFFSLFCVSSMALIGPVLTCTAISSERLHKTLAVLLMTPISAWQIVAGKFFSRLLTAAMLIGLSLPVLALVRLLGGVEVDQMFGVIVLCATMALFAAAIGLFFSTFLNRAYAVILLSYATMMFLYLFVPFVIAMTLSRNSRGMPWATFFATINPFVSTAFVAIPEMRMTTSANWGWCVAVHAAGAAVLLICSALAVRWIARREGGGAAQIGPLLRMLPPLPAGVDALAESALSEPVAPPVAATESRGKTVWNNPVLWREWRRPLMTRRWQRIVGGLLCVGLLCSTYLLLGWNDLRQPDTQIGYACIFNGLATLLVCVLSATAIAQEKESDTWTLLLATPLSAGSIVIGKLLGLARRLMGPALLIAAHFFAFSYVLGLSTVGLILWVIFSFNAVWVATGMYLSLRCRKVTLAVILNLMLPLFFYAALPLILLVMGELWSNRGGDLVEATTSYLPYYYLAEGIENIPRRESIHVPWLNETVGTSAFLNIAFVVGCAQLGLAALIVWRTSAHFNRMVGRATQRRENPADGPISPQRPSTL